eukprot:6205349-Pleurochrysis_carterae.AAC.5
MYLRCQHERTDSPEEAANATVRLNARPAADGCQVCQAGESQLLRQVSVAAGVATGANVGFALPPKPPE